MKLTELLQECDIFLKSKQTEEDINEFNSVIAGIKVQKRLPLMNKRVVLNLVDMGMTLAKTYIPETERDDTLVVRLELEKCLVLHGLLSYTNLEKDLTYLQETDYDKLLLSGLIDYVEEQCGKDYNELKTLYLDAQNISTLIQTTTTLESLTQFNPKEIEDFVIHMKNTITPEELETIKSIMEYNDPSIKQIKDILAQKAVEDIHKETKEEKK